MNARTRRFREQAMQENGGRSGVRLRYSERLRREAVAYWEEKQLEGMSQKEVAKELGIHAWSLSRWARSAHSEGKLRRVEVVSPRKKAVGESAMTLVTPEGFRVEGLEVDGVLQLLRVLR